MARRPTVTFNLPGCLEDVRIIRETHLEENEDEDDDDTDDEEEENGKQTQDGVLWYDVTDSDSNCSTQEYFETLAAFRQLKRDSLSFRRHSTISTASAFIKEALHAYDADDTWSLTYLRRRFERKDQETLFKSYQLRLRYVFFFVYLLLQIAISGTQLVFDLYSVMNQRKPFSPEKEISTLEANLLTPEIIGCSTILALSIFLFCLNFNENFFVKTQKFHVLISAAVILVLFVCNFGLSVFFFFMGDDFGGEDSARIMKFGNPIYMLFVCYGFVPLSMNLQCVAAGLFVSVGYSTVSLLVYIFQSDVYIWKKVASDFLILFMVNLAGLYTRYINEITFRRVFLYRKGNLETKLKVDRVKHQEEALLLSVLPKTVMQKVKEDYRRYIYEGKLSSSQLFRNRYLNRHDNVSILYADIVNFTVLTTKFPVDNLVQILNDLFEQFDQEAERNNCLRIKILGDCYYCVSGVPENQMHANNCIRMGLKMIDIIRRVRSRFEVDVNMRIGIHSGTVLCGIIGLLKFQYDVWGDDVTIANRMEQTGIPGRVHISGQTLSYVRDKEFDVEEFTDRDKDELLISHNIQSFLVIPRRKRLSLRRSMSNPDENETKILIQNSLEKKSAGRLTSRNSATNLSSQELDINISYKQSMDEAIQAMPLKMADQWLRTDDINPFLLTFTKENWNIPLLLERDFLSKFYISASLPFTLCITLVQHVLMPGLTAGLISGIVSIIFLVAILTPIICVTFGLLKKRGKTGIVEDGDPEEKKAFVPEEGNMGESNIKKGFEWRKIKIQKMIRTFVAVLNDTFVARIFIYFLIVFLLSVVAFSNMIECEKQVIEIQSEKYWYWSDGDNTMSGYLSSDQRKTESELSPLCCDPWVSKAVI